MIVLPEQLYDEAVKQGTYMTPYVRSEKIPPATDPTKTGKRKTAFEILQTGNRKDRRRAMAAITKHLKSQRA